MDNLLPAPIYDSVLGQLVQLKKAINYHNENFAPHYNDMEEWERKEYQNCQENRLNEYTHHLNYVRENEAIFNTLPASSKMPMSFTVFIAKYA